MPAGAPAYREEIFGPVAPVVRVRHRSTRRSALANDTDYGLSLGILTRDVMRGLRVAERIPSGLVHINDQTVNDEATVAVRRRRDSGTGSRQGGAQANLDAFTETQWVTVRGLAADLPDVRPAPDPARSGAGPGPYGDRTGAQPQTSAAVSTTSRSLAACSSAVSALPSTVEEKPHCGDRQSCSSGTYLLASSIRRLRVSLSSSSPRLVVTRPRTTSLARRHEPQRRERAGPLVVVLQEEPVDLQLGEQRLGDEVVAALGRPGGAEVAPAQVGGDVHAPRPAGERGVDLADVALVLVLGVTAALGDHRPLRGVVEVGQAGVVQLQVGAAELARGGAPPRRTRAARSSQKPSSSG